MSVRHSPRNKINDNTESSESSPAKESIQIPPPPPLPTTSAVKNKQPRIALLQISNSRERTTLAAMPVTIDSLKTKRKTFKSRLTRISNWLKSDEAKDALTETIDLKLIDLVAKFSDWEAD